VSKTSPKLILILIYNKFYGFIIRNIRLSLIVTLVRVFKKLPLLLKLLLKVATLKAFKIVLKATFIILKELYAIRREI
jgi:hypothetical protein